jgi:hypothetical protein
MSTIEERALLRNLKASCNGAAQTYGDCGEVVAELNPAQMVGAGRVFERGSHVPITLLAFFKPPATPFVSEIRGNERWSEKEGEHDIAAGV